MRQELVHQELSYQILGCAYEVYNELGPFYREAVYVTAQFSASAHRGRTLQSPVPGSFFEPGQKT
ncbi:MAG: GxxExxY protein, partial [Acidobacteriota bacterium]